MMCSIVKVQGERGGGKMRQIFPRVTTGQKSNGRGVQLRVPLSFDYRVLPLSFTIYMLWFPTGRSWGEAGKAPPRTARGLPETQKAVPSAKDPTPPE